jgi:hypothetical protein
MKDKRTEIVFDYDGMTYRLAYTPASIKKMEESGFDFAKMGERLLSTPEEIFKGALLAYHSGMRDEKAHEIYMALARSQDGGESDNDELMNALGDMLTEAIEEITSRGKTGNVKWRLIK